MLFSFLETLGGLLGVCLLCVSTANSLPVSSPASRSTLPRTQGPLFPVSLRAPLAPPRVTRQKSCCDLGEAWGDCPCFPAVPTPRKFGRGPAVCQTQVWWGPDALRLVEPEGCGLDLAMVGRPEGLGGRSLEAISLDAVIRALMGQNGIVSASQLTAALPEIPITVVNRELAVLSILGHSV